MMPPKTILVVSDDLVLYRLLVEVLSEEGYQVSYAQKNGQRLRRTIDDYQPDLIVIDTDKSSMKGVELSLLIRQWSPSPILILTNAGSGTHEVRTLNLETKDGLSEPFDACLVATRVNHILSLSPAG